MKNFIIKSLFTSVMCIVIGLLFLVLPSNDLVNFVFNACGIIVIALNIIPCIYFFALARTNERLYSLAVMYLIPVILGFVIIFNHYLALAIVLGIYLIFEPILRIIILKDKKKQIFKELPYFLIALVLFFVPAATGDVLNIGVKIFGGVILFFGVVGVIYNLLTVRNNNDDGSNGPTIKKDHGDIIDIEYKEL